MHEQQPEQPDEASALPDHQPEPQAELAPAERPRIWVGSWSDYNNGILHGQWIDAAREPEDIRADIDRILAQSPTAKTEGIPAEEWGIFDFDNFHDMRIDEQQSLSFVSKVATGIATHGPAYAAWAAIECDEDHFDEFEDRFIGHFGTVESYILSVLEDLGYESAVTQALPDGMRPYVYFDLSMMAHDMRISGSIHVAKADDGGVWIFRGY